MSGASRCVCTYVFVETPEMRWGLGDPGGVRVHEVKEV